MYGVACACVMSDDTIICAPGLQMPTRYKKFGVKPPTHGVMIAARLERLDMNITSASGNNFGIGSVGCTTCMTPTGSETAITSIELGVNYWYSKRFRATFNYVLNVLDGTSASIASAKAANGGNSDEHELLFRLAVAL